MAPAFGFSSRRALLSCTFPITPPTSSSGTLFSCAYLGNYACCIMEADGTANLHITITTFRSSSFVYALRRGRDLILETQSGKMASNNNSIARSGLPMSYSQSSIGSANTLNFSHSQMGSFNASQSVASTPRATPPPPKVSHQSTMSFSYPNSMPAGSRSRYGGFDESSGYGPVMSVHEGFKPQIYRVRRFS